ncbi:MAG: hypothetical protein Q4D02_06940 [Clostridia bacterium]|nr:hypothetical protein [Clostridia bacterium]
MIDDLFNLIINKSDTIPSEFYELLNKLELNYTKEMIKIYSISNLQLVKDIIYTLYSIYEDNLKNLLFKVKREELITLYNVCKSFETDSFIPYYKKAIINKYMS